MMPTVVYVPKADDDLAGIVEYIARDNPAAAREWLERVRATCGMLAKNPELGEFREGFGVAGCRSFSVGTYVLFSERRNKVSKSRVWFTEAETCEISE